MIKGLKFLFTMFTFLFTIQIPRAEKYQSNFAEPILQYYFYTMNNKLSITYLILMITPFFFDCRGPLKEEHKSFLHNLIHT
jgi:hypothetical protein